LIVILGAADAPGCPAARQTIYAYERGGPVARALTVPVYHVTTAWDLVGRLQPSAGRKR
jgi:hypothetical protein